MSEIQTITQKLYNVQQKIGAASKTSDNPFFKSRYADLNEVLGVAKEALHTEGLFLSQGAGLSEFGRYVETSVIDSASGQQISCRVPFSGNEKNMQEIGAAITYGRRFGVVSLLAMEQEDDDGETAVGRGAQAKTPVPKATAPTNTPKPEPIQTTVSKGFTRKNTLEKISLTSKVIIDSKRATLEDVVKMLEPYKAKAKEDLTDEQAKDLLTKLEEKLK